MPTPTRMPVQAGRPFDYREFDTTGYEAPTDAEVDGIGAVYQTTGFGDFADYEILKVLLDSSGHGGQRDLTVWILAERRRRVQDDPNSSCWFEVQITFYELQIEELELWDFNQQNVIWYFIVKRQDDGKLAALIGSKFGCGFKLICERAKLLSIEPTTYRGGPRVGAGEVLT